VHLSEALQETWEVAVLTSDRDVDMQTGYTEIHTGIWLPFSNRVQVCYLDRSKQNWRFLLKQIRAFDPDAMYLNSMFSARFTLLPLLALRLGQLRVPRVVLAPRGMLRSSALSFKSRKKQIFLWLTRTLGFFNSVHFHATDAQEAMDIQKHLQIKADHITTLPNLSATTLPPLKMVHKTPGKLRILYLARIHPIKNLHVLLQAIKSINPTYSIELSIVGNMEDVAYWTSQCLPLLEQIKIAYEIKKPVPHDQILELLQSHHVFALPTQGENFGHSILEALQAGRPVLISDQTPWTQLEEKGIGFSLPLNTIDAFTHAIETFAAMDQNAFDQYAEKAWQFAHVYAKSMNPIAEYNTLFSPQNLN
jgi:glycosyltransferase involved in cell wall biosynthesis